MPETTPPAPLILAIEIDGEGAHPAAWRRAAHPPTQLLDPDRLRRLGEIVERAGFAVATIADDLSAAATGPAARIGAIERAAYLASVTTVLSVVPAIPTTYTEPFHVSSALASIDHISAGRSGWLATASTDPDTAKAWGRPVIAEPAGWRREARDAADVVSGLWDTWEDDAVIRDVASSRYLDRDRLHYLDFVGEAYSVKGPAIVPRPPQGRLPIFASPDVLDDDRLDVALLSAPDGPALRAQAGASRAPRRFAEIEVALDTPDEAADTRVAALAGSAPWPETDRLRYVGRPDGLVQLLQDLIGVVDGVRLHPLVLDEDLAVLSQRVVPPLLASRAAARPLPGASLRTHLGLARPISQFSAAAPIASTVAAGGSTR